jgi:hypothetical protein
MQIPSNNRYIQQLHLPGRARFLHSIKMAIFITELYKNNHYEQN